MRVIFALLLLCTSLPAALAAPPVGVVKTPNGLTAWLVTDKNLPLINIKMAWRGGARTDPPKAAGLTALLAKLLTQGAGDMAATQFQVALDEHAIRLSFSADDDYVTGSLRCLSQYQARCFELLRLAITAPRFDASAIERLRRIQKARLKIRAQNPRTLAADNFFRMIFGDHPYGRPVGGTADGLDAITKQKLQSHYQQVFRRDNVLIAVVGDISERVLAQQLDQIFAPAATNQAQATALAPKPVFPKPQHTHQQRASPQTTLLLGHGGINYEDADFFAGFVMNHILGGGVFHRGLIMRCANSAGLPIAFIAICRTATKLIYGWLAWPPIIAPQMRRWGLFSRKCAKCAMKKCRPKHYTPRKPISLALMRCVLIVVRKLPTNCLVFSKWGCLPAIL